MVVSRYAVPPCLFFLCCLPSVRQALPKFFLVLYFRRVGRKATASPIQDSLTKSLVLHPDTSGIVTWNKPYFLEGRDGEEYAVFLMDTQGAIDSNSSIKDCVAIFAMSTLLSSVQIFNLSKGINSNDLNNLRLFTEYARVVQSDTAPFQKLLFLVRDWPFPGNYPYGLLGGEQYLKKDALRVTVDQPRENQEVRRELAKILEKLEACLLPHPGKQVAVNNSKEYLGEIEEELRSEVLSLMSDLFKQENLLCKKINGKEITGGEFCQLFKAYMKAFNSGELPDPKTIVEATAEAVMSGALEAAKKVYDQKMTEAMEKDKGLSDLLKLKDLHNSAEAAGLRRFEERPKIGKDKDQKIQQCLRKYCESRYPDFERIVERNKELAEKDRKLAAKEKELRDRPVITKTIYKEAEPKVIYVPAPAPTPCDDPISAALHSVADGVENLGKGVVGGVSNVCHGVVDGLENVGRGKIVDAFGSVGKGAVNGVGSVVKGTFKEAESVVRGAGELTNW